MSTEVMYTVAYGLLSACFVCPPSEFISAGLTVQSIFASLLGSEQLSFTSYHIRRTSATVISHAVLPIGYFVGMILANNDSELDFLWPSSLPLWWIIYLLVSVLVLLVAIMIVLWWSRDNWNNHPLARQLHKVAPANSTWRAIASSINAEFRRYDKFSTGPTPGRRVIVTDSWLLRTSAYRVDVGRQADIHLAVVGSDEHALSPEASTGVQYLSIDVAGVNIRPFRIRLNAAEYQDLKDKLRSPILNIRNVIILQSLSERFLDAFRHQIDRNEIYRKPPDAVLEACVGCMQATSNVKLWRRCADDNDTQSECRNCFCRPMWCIDCMGRWFASRQDQTQPETWLSCRCPCPTCRAPFCMLDVCHVR